MCMLKFYLNKMANVLSKSTFTIDPKRTISVGILLNKKLSIIVYLDYKNSQDQLILDEKQWRTLMEFQIFNNIVNTIQNNAKRIQLGSDFSCTTNPKTDSVILRNKNERMKLTRINLLTLQMISNCIEAHITERLNKLELYQKSFNDIYSAILNDVNNFSSECRRIDFITAFVANYDFQMFATDTNALFIHELKINYDQIINLIMQELLVTIV